MSTLKNSGLDKYGTEPFKQQQFETAGAEWLNYALSEQESWP